MSQRSHSNPPDARVIAAAARVGGDRADVAGGVVDGVRVVAGKLPLWFVIRFMEINATFTSK